MPPSEERTRYLVIYELDTLDFRRVNETFSREHRPSLKAAGRLSDIIDVTWRGVFRAFQTAS